MYLNDFRRGRIFSLVNLSSDDTLQDFTWPWSTWPNFAPRGHCELRFLKCGASRRTSQRCKVNVTSPGDQHQHYESPETKKGLKLKNVSFSNGAISHPKSRRWFYRELFPIPHWSSLSLDGQDVSLSRCIWRAACPPSDHPGIEGKHNISALTTGVEINKNPVIINPPWVNPAADGTLDGWCAGGTWRRGWWRR